MPKRKYKDATDEDNASGMRKGGRPMPEAEKLIKEAMKRTGVSGNPKHRTLTIGLKTIWNRSDDEGILLFERIEQTVLWVSRAVDLMTLFGNWLVLDTLRLGNDLPFLDLRWFLDLLHSVTRTKGAKYMAHFERFCATTGHTPLEHMQKTNRVMEYKRIEMLTAAKQMFAGQFFKRRLSYVRWRVANGISGRLASLPPDTRKNLLYRITKIIMDDGGRAVQDYSGLHVLTHDEKDILRAIAIDEKSRLDHLRSRIQGRMEASWVARRVEANKKTNDADNASKRKKVIITEEQLRDQFRAFSTQTMVEMDPMAVLWYYGDLDALVQSLPLTQEMDLCKCGEDFKKRLPWVWERLRRPAFSPMPFARTGRQFIRIDTKVLQNWHVSLREDVWWMENLVDLYAGGAKRIHQLKENSFLSDPRTAKAALEVLIPDGARPTHRPCLPGASFMTDGVAIHLSVLGFPSAHDHLDTLHEAGYTGVKVLARRDKVNLVSCGSGIHKLESCFVDGDISNMRFVGVDPGAIQVAAYTWFVGAETQLPREEMVSAMIEGRHGSYSETEYIKNTGREEAALLEKRRRTINEAYGAALASLVGSQKKTLSIVVLEDYARRRAHATEDMQAELLSRIRSLHRRIRFIKIQRCIDHMAHRILGDPNRYKRARERRQRPWAIHEGHPVVFFGRALFSGTKGHVTVPRKKLIRALGCRATVVLVDEYNTSKLCPIDFSVLRNGDENRLRLCNQENHGGFSCDRDVIGAVNIAQKAIFELLGRPLAPLYSAQQAA